MTSAPLAAASIALAVAGLIVTALGGWPGPMVLAVATLAALASVAIAPTEEYVPTPTVTITDRGGHFEVAVDRHDGRGPQLGLTCPTWRGAQVPEARERGYMEGLAYTRSFCRRRWPAAEPTEHNIRPEHARTGA